jgi:hypothetical protein
MILSYFVLAWVLVALAWPEMVGHYAARVRVAYDRRLQQERAKRS